MSTILITGGTGMIGTALTHMLIDKGHRIIILSRNIPPPGRPRAVGEASGDVLSEPYHTQGALSGLQRLHWDPAAGTIDAEAIRQADYIVNLAGAGVADQRWNAKRKKVIEESRTGSAALLVKSLKEIPNKVQAVISSSAIGWYGPDPSIPNPHPFDETAPAAADFLGETCRLWEAAVSPITEMDKRLVIIRTGVVLSRHGGALAEFRRPVRFRVAAILGSGRQIMSWIHIEDLCRLYINAIEKEDWTGVFNGVAPEPASNRVLSIELARCIKGRFFVPVYVPSFLLKIILGEMSIEVLKSVTVSAEKAGQAGFRFLYPSIGNALHNLESGARPG
jgi:uncharacterized protein (TIGR01777 family)